MKKHVLKSLLGLVLIAMTLSGCDLFDKAADVTFDVELDVNFVTDENGEFSNVTYVGDPVTLDLESHPEIAPYISKIKKVELTKIEYSITSYTSEPPGTPVTFSNGTMMYNSVGASGAAMTLSTVGSVNLMTAGGPNTLPKDDANFNALAALLLDKKEAVVFTQGTLSSTPVSFNIPTTFYLKITASALE